MADVGRINSLCEQYAAAKTGQENIKSSLKRAAAQGKLKFMTSGKAQLSQICGAIELQASRTGAQNAMARALREHVGNLKFQIDLEMRIIIKEDQEEQHLKKKQKEQKQQSAEH